MNLLQYTQNRAWRIVTIVLKYLNSDGDTSEGIMTLVSFSHSSTSLGFLIEHESIDGVPWRSTLWSKSHSNETRKLRRWQFLFPKLQDDDNNSNSSRAMGKARASYKRFNRPLFIRACHSFHFDSRCIFEDGPFQNGHTVDVRRRWSAIGWWEPWEGTLFRSLWGLLRTIC